jgi:hypothetical protein
VPGPAGLVTGQRAAEHLHAVGEPDQARSAARFGAADAVVPDGQARAPVGDVCVDVDH